MADENWERRVIEQIAVEGLREQTRARRWRIFFLLLTFAFLSVALLGIVGALSESQVSCLDRCTAKVELLGELDADGPVSAENVMAGLQAAFKPEGCLDLRVKSGALEPTGIAIFVKWVK